MSFFHRRFTLCLLVFMSSVSSVAWAATTAQFGLRTAGGGQAQVGVGQTLNLEIYVTLSGSVLPGNAMGYSFCVAPSTDGVISAATNNFASSIPSFPPVFYIPAPGSSDDQPKTGQFGRQAASFSGGVDPSAFPLGVAVKLGTFSVTGLHPGTTSYSFIDDQPYRGMAFDFQDPQHLGVPTTTAWASAPAFTITVTPEPGLAGVMFLALLFARKPARAAVRP